MLSGEFERKLRKLNPRLRIFCKDDDSKPAGLFIVENDEYKEICGVDKNFIPPDTIYNMDGTIYKSGWKRVLRILIGKKLIDERKAKQVFNTSDLSNKSKYPLELDVTKRIHKNYYDLSKEYGGEGIYQVIQED